MKATTFGDSLNEEGVEMGPLVSKQQLEDVEAAVAKAVSDGAKVVLGGKRTDRPRGFYYPATVLTDCRQETDILQKEIFGPVLPITTFKDLDEAIEKANDCEYGLTSSIYTQNIDVVMRACNEIKFGETYVNRENFEAMQGFHAGWRKSGIGGADGKHGVEEYLANPRGLHRLQPAEEVIGFIVWRIHETHGCANPPNQLIGCDAPVESYLNSSKMQSQSHAGDLTQQKAADQLPPHPTLSAP